MPLRWVLGFAFTKQPTWLSHLSTHRILEDDNVFLHAQGLAYRAGSATQLAPDWPRRLHMPITSDAMVIAFRRCPPLPAPAQPAPRGAPHDA